jgi:NAD-dependent SIR2 family protein deacetylase
MYCRSVWFHHICTKCGKVLTTINDEDPPETCNECGGLVVEPFCYYFVCNDSACATHVALADLGRQQPVCCKCGSSMSGPYAMEVEELRKSRLPLYTATEYSWMCFENKF